MVRLVKIILWKSREEQSGSRPLGTRIDYSDLCLKWDVILNGPAYCGPWPDCESRLRKDGVSGQKIADLRRFCDQLLDGDLVVLRQGTQRVHGVGEIVGEYDHHEEFNDVDGWEIGHIRRVRWLWNGIEDPKQFPPFTLNWGDTTQLLPENASEVRSWLKSLDVPQIFYDQTLKELPPKPPNPDSDITFEQISEHLFREGVASNSISHLLNEIGELIRIARWYEQEKLSPSESETINYLVVPLLRALGWTPQRMAIEWNRVDIALFSKLPRERKSLAVAIEAKKIGLSCFSAYGQAKRAAKNADDCQRIILTEGLRFGVFKKNGKHEFALYAYLNLRRLRRRYPLYDAASPCLGAQDALLAMTPEWR